MRLGNSFGLAVMMFLIFGPLSLALCFLLPETRENPLMHGFLALSLGLLGLVALEPIRFWLARRGGRRFVPLSVVGTVLLTLGMGLGLPGLSLFLQEAPSLVSDLQLDREAATTSGTLEQLEVLHAIESEGSHGFQNAAKLRFAWRAANEVRVGVSYTWVGGDAPEWLEGQEVVVEHLPDDPAVSRIQGTRLSPTRFALWIAAIFLPLGLALGAGALRIFLGGRKAPSSP